MTRKEVLERKPELWHNDNNILVEIITNKPRVSAVGLSAVHKEKVSKNLEFADRVITCPSSLLTLKSLDSDSYMSSSNHINIVSAISDSESGDSGLVVSHESYDLLLLFRRHSTAQNCPTVIRGFDYLLRYFRLQTVDQGFSCNYKGIFIIYLILYFSSFYFRDYFVQSLNQILFSYSWLLILFSRGLNDVLGKLSGKELARESDIDSSFDLIAGENPHLDACFFECSNSFADAVLKFIFNGCGADKDEILF